MIFFVFWVVILIFFIGDLLFLFLKIIFIFIFWFGFLLVGLDVLDNGDEVEDIIWFINILIRLVRLFGFVLLSIGIG